jgi:hypothetical protein
MAALFDKSGLGGPLRILGRRSLEIFVVHTMASATIRIALHVASRHPLFAWPPGRPISANPVSLGVPSLWVPVRVHCP